MQDPAAHGGQQREDALERRTLAAGEDRDVAGIRAMAAAGDRTVDRLAAERAHLLSQAADLRLVGGRHLHPDPSLAHRREEAVPGLQHRRRRGGGGEAGDDRVRGLHHPRRALPPVRARVQERPRGLAIEVSHRQVESVAQQRARELAADVAESDEADSHALVLRSGSVPGKPMSTRHLPGRGGDIIGAAPCDRGASAAVSERNPIAQRVPYPHVNGVRPDRCQALPSLRAKATSTVTHRCRAIDAGRRIACDPRV